MKKFVVCLLIMCMALGMAACGSTAAKPADSTGTPAASGTAADSSAADSSAAGEAPAAAWPSDDVTVYITNDVGAPTDLAARVLVDYLSDMTGVNFVIENDSTGGGARLGAELYDAKPDGTTLMITSPTCITSYYQGYWEHNLSDPEAYTIIAPSIGPSIDSGSIMMTQTNQPFNNIEELVAYCEENPNTITVGYAPGTIYEPRLRVVFRHFGIEDKVRWVSATNDDMITGLLGGTINIGMYAEDQGVDYITDGKLKALLLTRSQRNYNSYHEQFDKIPILPDVAEDYSDMLVLMPMVLCGPANMDEETVNYINELCSVILENEEYAERVAGLGGISTYEPKTPEELRQIIADLDVALELVNSAK